MGELKREEDKLKRRGLRGIALRQEMLEVNKGIVRRRLQRDRERMDRLIRERNDWPRRMIRQDREVEEKDRQERREKEDQEEQERKERKEKREKEDKEREERKERKEKERRERRERKEKESEAEVQQWMETSGLSMSRLASRLGKIHTEGDDSVASTPKAIGDDDADMDD